MLLPPKGWPTDANPHANASNMYVHNVTSGVRNERRPHDSVSGPAKERKQKRDGTTNFNPNKTGHRDDNVSNLMRPGTIGDVGHTGTCQGVEASAAPCSTQPYHVQPGRGDDVMDFAVRRRGHGVFNLNGTWLGLRL